MKINTFFKLFLPVLLIITSVTNGQVKTPFNVRYQKTVHGDITMISNSIMRDPSAGGSSTNNFPDNGSNGNDWMNMQYIDIDGDPTTFNSSSANLDIAKFPDCSRIKYAGLYWGGTYKYNINSNVSSGRTEDWNQVKLKVPGGTYIDIIATGTTSGLPTQKIYDGFHDPNQTNVTHSPYSCYADITSLVTSLADPKGNYFVGNIRVSKGDNTGLPGGVCGGWTIVIVYEKESLTAKNITTFDGHAVIASNSGSVNIPVNGFQTIPSGPVNAKLGVIAFEGDISVSGDGLKVAGLSPTITPSISQNNLPSTTNNYFNSSTTINGVSTNTTRNPTSLNTLGWDTHLENIPNALNSVIPNNETGATLTASTTGDKYDIFFAAFAVDVITPDIPIIKTVENTAGVNISGQTLSIGQTFYYTLNFDNVGNDNATAFTIQDILPTNVVFPTSGGTLPVASDFILPAGVTYTYNPTTRKIIFTIPNSLVTVTPNAPNNTIKIKVRAPGSCNEVVDACANVIANQAYATYTGVTSHIVTTQSGSNTGLNSCNFVVPGPTNYLLNIDNCTFTNSAILCGNSVTLTAANGYTSYQWTNSSGTVIGTTQTISVSAIGTYNVLMSATTPCKSITEVFTVTNFVNATTVNPIIPFADEVVICPNDGSQLPKIILCGINDNQVIQTGINATNIVWEQLNTASCPAVTIANCANTNTTCTWNQVGTGPNFTATNAGQYRITIYQNGCFKTYYFNVYKNLLNPTITPKNIVCTTQGNITITNISAGYEFSLSATGPFQSSNVIPIATAGTYTVYIRQTGVTNGCLFSFPNISVISQNFNVNIIKGDKLCNNGYGSINVQMNGVNPQYDYELSQGSTVISTFGPSALNFHVFSNLNPGTYTVTATTTDGCTNTQQITIADLSNLTLNATVSQNISCTQGNIQLNSSGGQPPYNYAIYSYNGVPVTPANYNFQTSVIFDVFQGQEGFYQFIVVDSNNCSAVSNSVEIVLEPTVVTTESHTNVTCFGVSNGTITITATPTNGYNVTYSLDAVNFQSSNVFTGLAPGTYTITVKYKKGTRECTYPITVTITQPTILQAQSQLTQQLTCTTTGTIQASASGGTSPYQYSINGVTFQSSNTFTGLTGGSYTVTVKDSNNCLSLTSPINIPIVLPPNNLTFNNTNVTCPNLTSNLTATVVGGNSPFTFQIIAPSTINASTTSGSVATFNNLTAGTYTIKVTDSKDCTYQENYTINPITQISVNGTVTSNVKCFGGNTGALSFNVTGFTGTYSYSINSGTLITNQTATTIPLTNLTIGNYSITVIDSTTNCQSTFSLTVTGPASALALSATPSQPTCLTTGSVNAIATGGWGSYQYTLTLPNGTTTASQNSGLFTNLTAVGTYTVTVIDANGCIVTKTFSINSFTNPTLVISPTSTLCYNTTTGATVILTTSGGTPPYQYQIGSEALQSSNTFTNLTPSSYTFNVVDSYGCTASVNQVINPLLVATASITKNLDCTASPDATINVIISGGVSAYQYQVKINGGSWSALSAVTGTSLVYSATTAGTYQFQITDASGCDIITNVVTVNPITSPDIVSLTQTQFNLCNGDSNAAFTINMDPNVGVSPFVFSVLNTTNGVNYGNQTSGLPAGSYTVSVVDANQCTDTASITITQPNPITFNVNTTDISCTGTGGTNFGEIKVVSVSGGTMPYTYHISNNFGYTDNYNTVTNEDHTFIVLNFGVYHVQVTDANNCVLVGNDIIIASPPNDLDIDVSTPTVSCLTGGTAVITVSTAVLSGSYEFGILTSNSSPYASSFQSSDPGTPETATFTGLTPGVLYTFVVHDLITNCYYFETAASPILSPSSITTNINAVNNVTCTGSNNGTISFTINGYDVTATSISYEIFNAQSNSTTGFAGNSLNTGTTITVTNFATLQPGMYYLLVTENGGANTGCTAASTTFSITESVILLSANASLIKNDNCNLNAGIVSASAVGGTAPYQYQILPDTATAPTVSTWVGATTNNFNVESGNYIVYIKDANNCIQSASITVGLDLAPTINLSLVDPCVAEGNYVVNVTRTNGIAPFTYSVDGAAAFTENNTTFSISNLSSGAHTIVVTDANGCTNTQNITILPKVTGTASATQQPSCANNDGIIQATASNGGGIPYSFTLQDNFGNPLATNATGLFPGLGYGSYSIVITDPLTCSVTLTVSLEQATPVTFTNSFVNPSCNANNNGSITVTLDASNNNPPYLYSLNNGITTQSSPIFNNLLAGSYTITVISNRNCVASQNVTLVDPAVLDVSATATTFACNANNTVNTVTITATATGGTTPYLYSIDGTNYQSATTFSVVDTGAVQNLTVYVKDVNSCLDSFPISINPLPVMANPLVTLNTALTCTNDENVTVTLTGGSGNFNYLLLPSGTPTATNTFNINAAGSYVFQIIDTTTGCTINTNPYTINPLPILQVQATALSAVNCFGDINGSLSFSVLNYTGNYNYQVFDTLTGLSVTNGSGSTLNSSVTVSGLPAGNFNVVLTETQVPLCTETSNVVTIGSPSIPISLAILQTAPVTCTNNQGTITAQTVGGNGTYEYQLVNTTTGTTIQAYNSNATFTGLSAGNYEVTVRDQNLCTDVKLITLTAPTAISATNVVSNNPLLCYNNTTAFVTVTATGGQGVYQYQLNYPDGITIAGPQTSNVFTNLGVGANYTVTVTDGWNCTFTTLPFTITQPTQIIASLTQQSQLTCTTNAQLLLTVSGGTPPYRYSTDGINFIPLTATPISVGAGTYHYYVTDMNNCTAILTNDILIEPITPLNITLDTSNTSIKCNGDNSASLIATVVGGLGNYQYSLLNASNAVIQGPQASSSFTGLGIGTYSIKVTSGDCIVVSNPVIITQPTAIDLTNAVTATNITCHGEKNGSITINVAGGTPLFQYAISPTLNQTSNVSTFNNLDVGSYDVLIQDANGCYRVITAQITEPAELTSSISSVTQELCEGNDDGSITIAINGGTPPYYTSFNVDTPGSYVQGQLTFNNISGGQTYIIYVKDSKGCQAPVPITMNAPVTLNPVLNNIVYDCTTTANPLNNTVTVSGISATLQPFVTYSLDNQTSYQSNNVYTNLANGNHIIYIKHTNGCVKQLPFTITNYLPLQGTLTSVDVLCNGSNTGSLTVSGLSGGSGSYQYAISPNYVYGTVSTFPNLVAGTYTVKVKDTNNCELALNRTITESTPIAVLDTIKQEDCIGNQNGKITISISGGVGPYSTSFNNQTNFVAGQVVFPNLSGGQTYTIYVKDALGCILPHPVTLDPPVNMHPSAFTTEVCLNYTNNTIQVSIQVDQQYINDVLYSIDGINFQQSNIFTNLVPGNYTGYVLHNLGCSSITAPFTINPISQLSLTAVESGLNQITATATFGSPPYTYYFNDEYQGANNVFMFYQSGVQTIKVKDNSGCEKIVLLPATFYDIEIPNYFTPDGNNHNDGWSPRKIDNFHDIKTKIYDRYGRIIKILSLGETWDGTYNNETLPSGDYWYLVEVNDNSGRTFVGNFTLYR